jgi:myo-inositol 2-dehydrogenase/D-chiro-inositol 1-dehydrogenase
MTDTHDSILGCALIGPGNFGRSLAQALAADERARLAGVLGATAEESAAASAALGGRAYAGIDTLLRDPAAQAVLIATPSHTHAELAVAAAGAGKHVFCEKPMALSVAECDAMIAAAKQAGVALMVGQVQRYFPLLAEARRLARSGELGAPMTALMYRHDMLRRQPGSWLQRREHVGGLLHQSCVHELDWLRFTLGEVVEVFARGTPAAIQPGLDFPDAAEISLRFESGCIATLSACMTSYVEQHGGAVQCTQGGVAFDMRAGALRWGAGRGGGAESRRAEYERGVGHSIATRAELRAFVDAALGQAPVPIPGEEGRANIEVIQAALISIAERRPVALPLPESERARRVYLETVSSTHA